MDTSTYLDIYTDLVIHRRMDVDEAQCLMTDLEMELADNNPDNLDAYEMLEELI